MVLHIHFLEKSVAKNLFYIFRKYFYKKYGKNVFFRKNTAKILRKNVSETGVINNRYKVTLTRQS